MGMVQPIVNVERKNQSKEKKIQSEDKRCRYHGVDYFKHKYVGHTNGEVRYSIRTVKDLVCTRASDSEENKFHSSDIFEQKNQENPKLDKGNQSRGRIWSISHGGRRKTGKGKTTRANDRRHPRVHSTEKGRGTSGANWKKNNYSINIPTTPKGVHVMTT